MCLAFSLTSPGCHSETDNVTFGYEWQPPQCIYGTMPKIGSDRCQPIGKFCPDETWTESQAGAIYVSPNGKGNGTTQNSPLSSIQVAIDLAQSGDTIILSQGNFDESLVIEKDLVIKGSCVRGTIIRSPGFIDWLPTILVSEQAKVRLENFTVTGGRAGIKATGQNTFLELYSINVNANHTYGVLYDEKSRGTMNRVAIRDCLPDGAGHWGLGLEVLNDSQVRASDLHVSDNQSFGVLVAGGHLWLRDSIITGTRPQQSDETRGDGISVFQQGTADLSNIYLADNKYIGISATESGTQIRGQNLVIKSTTHDEANSKGGLGLKIAEGAEVYLAHTDIVESQQGGILVQDSESYLEAQDLLVKDTIGDEFGQEGWGMTIHDAASVKLNRASITNNQKVGVLVSGHGSSFNANELEISETSSEKLCPGGQEECTTGFGYGLINVGASVQIENFSIHNNAKAGLVLFDPGRLSYRDQPREFLSGETFLSARAGSITENSIGVNLQVDSVQKALKLVDVPVTNNEETNISSEALPVPNPSESVEDLF